MKYFFLFLTSLFLQANAQEVSTQDTIAKIKTRYETGLRSEPELLNSFFNTIPAETEVYVLDYKNGFWMVSYFDLTGWASSDVLWKTRKMYDLKRKLDSDIKKKKNIETFGEEIAKKVNDKQVWIGMTKEMLLASKGEPKDKNISTGSWGKHEQWIYPSRYIYIEDGVITSFQSSF